MGKKEPMNDHASTCRHYSIFEPFQALRKGDIIIDKGFLMWKNFFEFLKGEDAELLKKSNLKRKKSARRLVKFLTSMTITHNKELLPTLKMKTKL